jgi:hypothetical protein
MVRPKEFSGETKPVGSRIPIETYNKVSKHLGRVSDSKFILEKYELEAKEIDRSVTGAISKDGVNSAVKGNDLETELLDFERKLKVAYDNNEIEQIRPTLEILKRLTAVSDSATRQRRSKPKLGDRLLEQERTKSLELRRKKPNPNTTAIAPVKETTNAIVVSKPQSNEDEFQKFVNQEKSNYHEDPMPKSETRVIDEKDENVFFYSTEN